MSAPGLHSVRALYRSVRVPGLAAPNDTAHLKVHYPAVPTGSDNERNTGMVAAADLPPCPTVLILPGINVGPEGLSWLARDLAARGMITVTYSLIGEELPGLVSLTPGIDIQALGPATFGTRPSALAIQPILDDLASLNSTGLLAGRIDLGRIALGGHSAGGTVALVNANPDWFPGVRAAFAYAAHTAAATMLGHPPGTMNPIDDRVPVLIAGGDADGVIAESAARYGDPPGDAIGRVVATFEHAVSRSEGDSALVIIRGANHFTIADPPDPTTGRPFLDRPDTSVQGRALIGLLIRAFLARTFDKPEGQRAWDAAFSPCAAYSDLRIK